MRVLWLKSDFPLPADTGGKIRTLQLLQELGQRCELTLLCYAPPDLERVRVEELERLGLQAETISKPEEVKAGVGFGLRVLSKIASRYPYVINKYRSPEMERRLTNLCNTAGYDVLLCDFLDMVSYGLRERGLPVVLFEHNVETVIWQRYRDVETHPLKKLYFDHEAKRMARFERDACSSVDLVLTVSDLDGATLGRDYGAQRCVTIPTGVDSEYFHPRDGEVRGNLVFCGSMDWMPNIDGFGWLYSSILPLIRKRTPDATLTVVGRRPVPAITEVGERDSGVTVTGTVDDVRPYVGKGEIYVVPLRVGGGTRIKIFEAMAMGKCVVSTTIGAEGLPVTDGENIVLADSAEEFADRISRLLEDKEERTRIGRAAREFVVEEHSWQKAGDVLFEALSGLRRDREEQE